MNFDTTQDLAPYCDRTPVHPYSRYRPSSYASHSDSETESYSPEYSVYIPRPLPNIARLQDERFRCERYLGWNIDWAVAFIVNHLDSINSPDAPDVLRRIRILAEHLSNENRSRDIACRVFNKLDQVLFAGHLKNAVFLHFANLGTQVSGATFTHGHGPNARVKRISIVLNSILHQHAKSRDIIASLIHQMIHAYFLVACGPQDEKEEVYGRLAHGVHFGKVMRTIKNLSAANGRPLPLGFEHQLGPHSYYDDYCRPSRPRHRGNTKWYTSHCHAHVEPIHDKDIDEWYSGVCKPLLELPDTVQKATVLIYNERHHELEEVPRSAPTTAPSVDSVEFIFQDRAILVPAAKVDPFLSIRRAFDKTKSRFLIVPEEIDKETFMRLLELLHLGRYSPDISAVCAPGSKGPPVIKPLQIDSLPYLLTDVRMFKLGVEFRFEEVKAIALERLNRQYITREDPVSVLKAIYDWADPDPDLRAWAKGFLTKGPEGDWLDPGMGVGMGGAVGRMQYEPPNLVKLDQDMGFKTRFRDLVECSSALHIDVLKTREFLLGGVGPRGIPYGDGVGMGRGAMGMGRQGSPPLGRGIGAGGFLLPWVEDEFERFGSGSGYGSEGYYGGGLLGDKWEDRWRPYG